MTRTVGQCFWALPTLSLPTPEWTQFTAAEWSCSADGDPLTLDDARVCRTCSRWAERSSPPASTRQEPSGRPRRYRVAKR
ncbi:MAG TPA: hypothetical protein VHI98_29600 [Vicinamibacterales bacterium]|jgi:hypothetical protein|nr:hypothetical protein [Vicinamibacterales bacterium]